MYKIEQSSGTKNTRTEHLYFATLHPIIPLMYHEITTKPP